MTMTTFGEPEGVMGWSCPACRGWEVFQVKEEEYVLEGGSRKAVICSKVRADIVVCAKCGLIFLKELMKPK